MARKSNKSPENEFETILQELLRRESTNLLDEYDPYPFQLEWHNAKGKGTDKPAKQKCLMCANKIGKTFCGMHELVYHLTGVYPKWWKGTVFDRPIKAMLAGVTVDLVRDTLQADLFGDPHDEESLGTGIIPKDLIRGKPIRKQGYVNSIDTAHIKHKSGGTSLLKILAYEQGFKKFYARGYDIVHYDEEPPQPIYSQGLRALIATKGIMNLTFTSEEGVTEVVDTFMNELKDGQAIVMATWDDARHISDDPEHRKQLLEAIPEHERDMRTKGIPKMGSGLIFPINNERLKVDPFRIPPYWPRICGIDLGGQEHPFAAVWLAWDRDNDTVYLYREYRNHGVLAVHADALKQGEANWIPVAWPHDVNHVDRQSGVPVSEMIRSKYGINMLPQVFSNPPAPGQKEGQGGQGVEAGLWAMMESMESGTFKVFSNITDWFREKDIYHRKNGKVVRLKDDLMSATRYAFQSLRFADIKPRVRSSRKQKVVGIRNW